MRIAANGSVDTSTRVAASSFGGMIKGVCTADGSGYWVAAAGGGVFTYGSAPFDGDMSGAHLNSQIIAASGW